MTPKLGGKPISRIGYGAMRLPGVGNGTTDPELSHLLLTEAISLGANIIDTADFYGNGLANNLISEALTPYSENLIISTKVGVKTGSSGRPEPAATSAEIIETIDRNLDSLRTNSLDLVFLRLPGGPLADSGVPIQKSVECLFKLQQQGVINHIGLSSASVEQITLAKEIAPISAIQNAYFVGHSLSKDVLNLCTKEEIPFLAYFPLGMGKLIQEKINLKKMAETYNATESQIALAWLLEISPMVVPIPGTSNIQHLRENMKAKDIVLSSEDMKALSNIV